jgi:hypothetical protein
MNRCWLALGALVALGVPPASAAGPPPIKLLLTPVKPPTPALKYQLLPDARVMASGDAASVYQEVIELLNKTSVTPKAELFDGWAELSDGVLPKEKVRKELAPFDKVYELLDKAARREHCDWGVRQRLRDKGIGAQLPELQPMRECGLLLALRARLETAEGHPDKALATLRTGFALARHVGEGETLIHYLTGVAIASRMGKQLESIVARPDAPNLYYALTDLPAPLLTMRKGLEGERLGIHGTFPALRDIDSDLDAGSLSEKDLAQCVKIVDGLSKGDEILPPSVGRLVMGWSILNKHEIAKQALIDVGRPRDKVEAMPHVQVALLHALLEYDAALDNLIVSQDRPYWELSDHVRTVNKRYLQDRWKNPTAAAIPLVPLVIPAVQKVSAARVRLERKVALLRTVEALRLYAADHDGKFPRSLAAVTEVPLPRDPATGKSFEYELRDDVAQLRAPPPAKEAANQGNTVTYLLKIRR